MLANREGKAIARRAGKSREHRTVSSHDISWKSESTGLMRLARKAESGSECDPRLCVDTADDIGEEAEGGALYLPTTSISGRLDIESTKCRVPRISRYGWHHVGTEVYHQGNCVLACEDGRRDNQPV